MPSFTILLAEHEPVISLDIQKFLEEKGCRVLPAPEWQDVIDTCEQYQPDLAILNFRQQDHHDGMALALALKERFMLPVMFITGARQQDVQSSKDFDSSLNILYKPFSRAQLRRQVYAWILEQN